MTLERITKDEGNLIAMAETLVSIGDDYFQFDLENIYGRISEAEEYIHPDRLEVAT